MSSLRRRPCSPSAAASPPDDDDLLEEILLRLPPQPSSLPRASAVCHRWRLLLSGPRFLRRFRIRHRRTPPLLGFFLENTSPRRHLVFQPTLDPPNRAPIMRFSPLQPQDRGYFRILNCHHGLVLVILWKRNLQVLVWDPVTGTQHHIAVPPGFEPVRTSWLNGAVLRAAAGDLRHFQLALMGTYEEQHTRVVVARVYSSETALWSNVISIRLSSSDADISGKGCVLLGNSLYWLLLFHNSYLAAGILEFDLDTQTLTVIQAPLDAYAKGNCRFRLTRAEGGGALGFLILSGYDAQLWSRRKRASDGVFLPWVLTRTIELGKLLSVKPDHRDILAPAIGGFAEHNNVLFLVTCNGDFMVQLESMQFKKLPGTGFVSNYHPFESVYTAGSGGEQDGGGF